MGIFRTSAEFVKANVRPYVPSLVKPTLLTTKPPPPPPKPLALLTEEDKGILYTYARLFNEITDVFGIPLFAIGGTLLGCVRDKDVIPWDDDIDYAIQEENEGKLNDPALLMFLNERGYIIYRETNKHYSRVYHILNIGTVDVPQGSISTVTDKVHHEIMCGKNKSWRAKNNLLSDIFIYKKLDSRYELAEKKKQYIDAENFSLTKYAYGPAELYSIANPEKYLTGVYGAAYLTPYKRKHNHRGY